MEPKEIEALQAKLAANATEIAALKAKIDDLLPFKMRCCQLDLQAVLDKHDVNLAPQTTFGITPRK